MKKLAANTDTVATALEYLRYAVSRGRPTYFFLTVRVGRTTHANAIRLLSQRGLLEKVDMRTSGQHWQPTTLGAQLVAEGLEASALI